MVLPPFLTSSSVRDQLKEAEEALALDSKKLCTELMNNQKHYISTLGNPQNDNNGQVLLLERIQTLEKMILNVLKRLEIQDQIIWGPAQGDNNGAVLDESSGKAPAHSQLNGRKEENRTESLLKGTKPRLLKPQPLSFIPAEPEKEERSKMILLKSASPGTSYISPDPDFGKIQPVVSAGEERSNGSSTPLSDAASKLNQPKLVPRMVKPGPWKGNVSPTTTHFPSVRESSCEELLEFLVAVFANHDLLDTSSEKLGGLASAGVKTAEDVGKVSRKVLELALVNTESAKLGARICQELHEMIPGFKTELISHCQEEFVPLITSMAKNPDLEKRATRFLWFLAHLYVHLQDKRSGRIKIFSLAIVELLRTLLGQGLDSVTENLALARELLKFLKPALIEQPDDSLSVELTKLVEQCEKLKAGGGMSMACKKNLLLASSAVRSILDGLKKATATSLSACTESEL